MALFFTSCEELDVDSENPFEASEGDQIPEIINWNYNVNGSSIDIDWEGNKYALEFRYKLETEDYPEPSPYLDWSEWTTDTSVTLNNLDDGQYTLSLKSRISNKEDDQGLTINFDIDAIQGCSIRMYPLYQEITPESDFDLFVYVEECHDLMLMELNLTFNQDQLEVTNITAEEIMPENTDLFETMFWGENGDITIIAGLLYGYSIQDLVNIQNGTTAVAKIRFHAKSNVSSQNEITIDESSILRDMEYVDINFNRFSGTVKVR